MVGGEALVRVLGTPDSGGRLIYAIGDLHGRVDLFDRLIARIRDDIAAHPGGYEDKPMVVLLGDYIDRGPASAQLIERILALHDAPLSTVAQDARQAGEVLVQHPDVDLVTLTGSTEAGARVAALAAPQIKRLTLELGGKSAFVLCPDADLGPAVEAAVRTAFVNNGQTCSATTRLVVPRELLAEVEGRIRVGGQQDQLHVGGCRASAPCP